MSNKKKYKIHSSVKRVNNEEKDLNKKLFDFKQKVLESKFKFYDLLNRLKKKIKI